MKLFFKVLAVMLILAVVFMIGFELWGEQFERLLNQEACARWFNTIRPFAWAVAIALLISDILLPIPATGIMAALGSVYGFVPGALISVVGSAGAGIIGYLLARFMGMRATRFLASKEETERFRAFFDHWGGPGIIVSRMMPILPEVMSILAGFANMSMVRFVTALFLGTVPTCFLFSYLGYAARTEPVYGVVIAIFIPLAIWPLFLRFVVAKGEGVS